MENSHRRPFKGPGNLGGERFGRMKNARPVQLEPLVRPLGNSPAKPAVSTPRPEDQRQPERLPPLRPRSGGSPFIGELNLGPLGQAGVITVRPPSGPPPIRRRISSVSAIGLRAYSARLKSSPPPARPSTALQRTDRGNPEADMALPASSLPSFASFRKDNRPPSQVSVPETVGRGKWRSLHMLRGTPACPHPPGGDGKRASVEASTLVSPIKLFEKWPH